MGRWQGYIGHVLLNADKGAALCLYTETENNHKSIPYKQKYPNLRINILPKLIVMVNFIYPL